MPLWELAALGLGGLLALVLLYGVTLIVRRRWIGRDGGTFELSYRARSGTSATRSGAGRGWVLGVGRYTGDRLEFFRVFSVVPRPMRTLVRGDLRYDGQRVPVGAEAHTLYDGHVVVGCSSSEGDLELAMTSEAVTGFLAWLEAAPPGARRLPH